jgi:hypothetical protein
MKKTVKSTTDTKSIKAALKLDGTIFNVKGHKTRKKNEAGEWSDAPQEFVTRMHISDYGDRQPIHSFSQNHYFANSMNVKRFGSSKVSLYTITPFGKIVKQTIPYSSITIVSVAPTETDIIPETALTGQSDTLYVPKSAK